ncbi:unnamed protein product (macronuclear) [Paramecium tetraurelia]|uniref:Arrestin-like N-terminal domain-containing protein n=1 Tax=Paramecium tetraurelia TaxID=5888 RepID=A0C8M4_PARTE|nr:uncharacterized protein GSPATT00036275001 [Paramecium tetraurelia]CAK67141.1 unnamed protein product [Paramecium tetraurelia]|eukprot:XP_001434538.1 hypothetical protein (macronuclear) [Paramecium tetraurelia strain d4-2]
MGLCHSITHFQGEINFEVTQADYQHGQYSGSVLINNPTMDNTHHLYVNLIGIEQITTKGFTVSNQFLDINLMRRKLNGEAQLHIPFDQRIQWEPIYQNYYSIISDQTLSTIVYLECFLAKSSSATSLSSSIVPNTRQIQVVKTKKNRYDIKPISLNYEPKFAGFAPILQFNLEKNAYRIGEHLKGKLLVDNTRSQFALVKNQITILQIIDLLFKNDTKYKRLPPQTMIQQRLDNMHSEKRNLDIDIAISQSFNDACTYPGRLYKVNYVIQLEFMWEDQQTYVMSNEIVIYNEND